MGKNTEHIMYDGEHHILLLLSISINILISCIILRLDWRVLWVIQAMAQQAGWFLWVEAAN